MSTLEKPSKAPQVTLSAEDAREVARLLALLLGDTARRITDAAVIAELGPAHEGVVDRNRLAARARAIFFERKRRSQHFSPAMFSEPAWDMLLALYITDFAGGRQTVGKLISWVGAPQTTALRWIDYLEKERLVARHPEALDRRIVYVDLTDKGRSALDRYFSTLDDTFAAL